MKRVISILFLSILLLQVAGNYIYFIVRLSAIRNEMRKQLALKPEHELTRFTFSHKEFRTALVDDHEFKVSEKMYDIARTYTEGERIIVLALHDEAEDNLLTLLNEMLKRSSKDKKPVPSSVLSLITLQVATIDLFVFFKPELFFRHCTNYCESASEFVVAISSPPPRG